MTIRLIISDMDGVLLDLKDIHFKSLNMALSNFDNKYVISNEEHLLYFDGLSTKNKLKILNEKKNLPLDTFDYISDLKQKYTVDLLSSFNEINYSIKDTVYKLKTEFKFYVASNAIRNTIDIGLKKLEINDLVDCVFSNQDVKFQKPNPEIYLRCMAEAGVSPNETLIIEDSKHGREAAAASGAHVFGVDNSFDFTYEKIINFINKIPNNKIKWEGKSDLNILIPMAGAGSRFSKEGYVLPKPLIDVNGQPMIQRVVDNLNCNANYIFVVQKQHYEKYNLETYLNLISPGCKIIQTDGVTEGAACTTLLAEKYIDNNNHLLIANSDQFVEWNSCDFMYSTFCSNADGNILTFEANDPKWSYVKTDEYGFVTELAEKKVISNEATIGFYLWSKGSDYVKYAKQMIAKNIRVNNEFYVAPVYNEAILDGKKIKTFKATRMFGLGTPDDLNFFLKNYNV